MDEFELKERLSREDPEFRRIYKLHRGHEERLEELSRRPYLSEDEEAELKKLKKEKLALKDQMYLRLSRFQKSLR